MNTDTAKTPGQKEKRKLPTKWRWIRLGEVIQEAQAGFACGERDAEGIVQLRMNNLDTRGNFIWDDVLRVPKEGNNIEPFLLVPGDVLFNNTNSTELVGKSALFADYTEPIVYSNHFTRLRPIIDGLLPEYLASWLNHQWQQGIFASICNRWIGQSAVKTDNLLSLEIPLPPLPEQRRIVGVLREQMAAVEKARIAAQARLEAIKALPAAFLRLVFPQPGQLLPDSWRWVKLGDVALQGPDNGVFKRREDFGSGAPMINVSDLYRSLYVEMALTERVHVTEDELTKFQIAPGDLFFCRSSLKREGIGWCCVVKELDEPSVFECHVMRVRLKYTDALPEYVAYYWQHPSVREKVIGNSRTATMTTMNQQDLGGVPIPLPPLVEQQQIAAALHERMAAMEKARTAAEAELAAINALPAPLLHRAFNGEL